MGNISFKQKLIAVVVIVGIALIVIFSRGINIPQNQEPSRSLQQSPNAKLLSTNPSPFDNSIILPTQTLEFTFSDPIENVGEFKVKLEPEAEINIILSDDRKTAKITPKSSFDLGQAYTLFITNETKFDGGKRLDQSLQFGFRTIEYKGV